MILLDTNALLWLVLSPENLGPRTRERLMAAAFVHHSAISHVEIRIKQAKGKIRVGEDFVHRLGESGLRALPLTDVHAASIASIPELEGHDPFDRMLVAQAAAEGLDFLTADRRLLALGDDWIIDARS